MQCPGQDSRYWDGEAVFDTHCSKCGNPMEFFKDDSKRKCKKCGNDVLNPKMDFGCASYCPHAEHCLGTLSPEMVAQKQEIMLDKVAIEMKRQMGDNFSIIAHLANTARYAKEMSTTEDDANKAVTIICSYFHLLGSGQSDSEHDNPSTLTREILTRFNANAGIIDEVCTIIDDYHNPILKNGQEHSVNYKIFHDAYHLAQLAKQQKDSDGAPPELAGHTFMTISGQKLAETISTTK